MNKFVYTALLFTTIVTTKITFAMFDYTVDLEPTSDVSGYESDEYVSPEIIMQKLFDAIEKNNIEDAKKVLDKYPEFVNALGSDNEPDDTAPFTRKRCNQDIIVCLVSDDGAYTTTLEGNISTPLNLAIRLGHPSMVTLLLQYNANPNKQKDIIEDAIPPLGNAIKLYQNGDANKSPIYYEIIKILLSHGANANQNWIINTRTITPLDLVICNEQHLPLLKLLLAHGAIFDQWLIKNVTIGALKRLLQITLNFDTLVKMNKNNLTNPINFLRQQTKEEQAILAYRTNFICTAENWTIASDTLEKYLTDANNTAKLFVQLCTDQKILTSLSTYAKEYACAKFTRTETQNNLLSCLQRGTFTNTPQGKTNQSIEFFFQN